MDIQYNGLYATPFPNIPEIVEQIFSFLDSKTLVRIRAVNSIWNLEALPVIERRGDITVSWIKGENTRELLLATTNPELFKRCSIANSIRFQSAARSLIFHNFGHILKIVTLNLGTEFIFRDQITKTNVMDNIYQLVTLWGLNIDCLELKLPLKPLLANDTELGYYNIGEIYTPKVSNRKVSNLKQIKLLGRLAPLFPALCLDLIKSSPKLVELAIMDVPPDVWFVTTLNTRYDMAMKNIAFLLALTGAKEVTKKLKKFAWTLTKDYYTGIRFDPMTEAQGAGIGRKLSELEFGQLEVLELDASVIGAHQATTDHLNIMLAQNQTLKEITFHPCSEYDGKSMIKGNIYSPEPVVLTAVLPNLKRLTMDSVRGRYINLLLSVINFPSLEILEVRKRDKSPFEYHVSVRFGYLFRHQSTIAGTPVNSVKKVVYDYPFFVDKDLHAVFDAFPNIEYLQAPMVFGSKFLFRDPNHTIATGTYHFPRKLHRMVLQFHKKMRKMKVLHVVCNVEVHYMKYWNQAFQTICKLKGLEELVIDCRTSDLYLPQYSDRIEGFMDNTFRFKKKRPFQIRIIPAIGKDKIFPSQT